MACTTRIILQGDSKVYQLFNDCLLFSLSFLLNLLLFSLSYFFLAVLYRILDPYKITCYISNGGWHDDKLTYVFALYLTSGLRINFDLRDGPLSGNSSFLLLSLRTTCYLCCLTFVLVVVVCYFRIVLLANHNMWVNLLGPHKIRSFHIGKVFYLL